MLSLEVALLSDRGGRDYNEDACGHWHSAHQLCCVLADGAGGHGGGDIASRLVVQEMVSRFSSQPTTSGDALAEALRQTNQALLGQRVPGTARQDMHSTAVCLVIDFVAQQAHWAHAGDSRVYWFRDRQVLARTRDHSLVQALVDAGCSLVLTTGGTGPALRDVTPEATLAVADKEMPGFGEQMRQISLQFVPTAILSRQVAVIRNQTLIVNLPGQPKAIQETLEGLRSGNGEILMAGIFAAVPYCIDLIGGPYLETVEAVCKAFRPKAAMRSAPPAKP